MNRAMHESAETQRLSEEIVSLRQQVRQAQAVIDQLHKGSAVHESGSESRAKDLLTANELLVVTAMRAQTDADKATRAFAVLSRSSELDALTELPNRQLLLSRFKYAISIARRTRSQLALLFVDLNNFKQINDSLGHGVGDLVLRLAAKRLATAVRGSDTVSRHGGDEFLILLNGVAHSSDVEHIASKLIAALGRPAKVGEHVLRLTASIGISLYPRDGEDTEVLIKLADAAMYRAKRAGDGACAFHADGGLEGNVPTPPTLRHPLSRYRDALTEQTDRQDLLRNANEQLVLSALNAQALQEAADQARRRQTDFLAVIAHELRNPLVPMQHAAALLQRAQLDESLVPRVQGVIERQVAQLSRLVGDLLDESQVSTGVFRIALEPVDISEIVNQTIASCRPTMDAKAQHLSVDVPVGPLAFFGDPIRLAQIFRNLLDNAAKYTPEGGEIAMAVVWKSDSFIATVTDSGIGIASGALATIFAPFIQDRSVLAHGSSGPGLGLTVAHELAAAHGGTITASSAGPGQGSQFTVTLPRQPVPASRPR